MKRFLILRIDKLKHFGNVGGAYAHVARDRETPNADPNRKIVRLIGDADVVASIRKRIDEASAPPRSNSVLAVEVFLSASPEFFANDDDAGGDWDQAKINAFTPRAIAWLQKEWGKDNLAGAFLHLDEKTPHVHAFVVPIDPDTGRLNARRWLGGRVAMRSMQDRCHESMKDLGLERGIKGSKAKHTKVSQWYAQMQEPVPVVPAPAIDPPSHLVLQPERWAKDQERRLVGEQADAIDTLQTQARAFKETDKKRRQAEDTNQALRNQVSDGKKVEAGLRQDLTQRDKQLESHRKYTQQFRDIPLSQVAGLFPTGFLAQRGISLAPDDKNRDRIRDTHGKVIGRNSIDLVMHATGMTYDQSLAWLRDRFGHEVATRAVIAKAVAEVRERVKPVDAMEWHQARVAKAMSLSAGQTLATARTLFQLFDLDIQVGQQGIQIIDRQLRCAANVSAAWSQEQARAWSNGIRNPKPPDDMPRLGMRR